MKHITEYINEALEEFRVSNVRVTYRVEPEELYIQAPEKFQESDIQQYMDDSWLEHLPSADEYAEKMFGKNRENIADIYFEYDKFEHLNDTKREPDEFIEYDNHGDTTNNDEKLDFFKIKNLRYIILFEQFDLLNNDNDEDKIRESLNTVFRAAESNNKNEYPITIKYDEDELDFNI